MTNIKRSFEYNIKKKVMYYKKEFENMTILIKSVI